MVEAPGLEQDAGLVAGILANHQNKPAAESQALVATVFAITEVLETQGLHPSPTALFAATLSALNTVDVATSPDVRFRVVYRLNAHPTSRQQIAAATSRLLSLVLPRVPPGVLHSKAPTVLPTLCRIAETAATSEQVCGSHRCRAQCTTTPRKGAVLLRWTLSCLPSLLAALHPRDAWVTIMPGFSQLIHHALAHKPKVR